MSADYRPEKEQQQGGASLPTDPSTRTPRPISAAPLLNTVLLGDVFCSVDRVCHDRADADSHL